jgi:hypothetical protein
LLPQVLHRPATCEADEAAPRLLGLDPASQHVGGYLGIRSEGLDPEARVTWYGACSRWRRGSPSAPARAFVALPLDLPSGLHEVRLMNPAACPGEGSFPVQVEPTPLPPPSCGLLRAEAGVVFALFALVRWRRGGAVRR